MNFLSKILQGFGYKDYEGLGKSLAPSLKYDFTMPLAVLSVISSIISRIFGLDAWAFAILIIASIWEVRSGIKASKIRGEEFESAKLSRFSFKSVGYIILLALPHSFSVSFYMMEKHAASSVFSWMHTTLALMIVYEISVSISENMSTIHGKPKTYYINKIKENLNPFKRWN